MTEAQQLQPFLELDSGYYKVSYRDRSWGLRVDVSSNGRRRKLYGEELGGTDHVSCNFYLLGDKAPLLKPCEMPAQKVLDFISGFQLQEHQAET